MGSRYYITGVQLGMLNGFISILRKEEVEKILNEILDKQYIGIKEDVNKFL